MFVSTPAYKYNKPYCLFTFDYGLVSTFAYFTMAAAHESYIPMFPVQICFSLTVQLNRLLLNILCTKQSK
jgi:hypothetical protein